MGNRLDVCLNGFALSGTIATADVEGHGATALSVRCGSQRVHAVRLDAGPKPIDKRQMLIAAGWLSHGPCKPPANIGLVILR